MDITDNAHTTSWVYSVLYPLKGDFFHLFSFHLWNDSMARCGRDDSLDFGQWRYSLVHWDVLSGVTKAREETSLEQGSLSLSHPDTIHYPRPSQIRNSKKINYSSPLNNVGWGTPTPNIVKISRFLILFLTNHGSYTTVQHIYWKKSGISEPSPFKPVLSVNCTVLIYARLFLLCFKNRTGLKVIHILHWECLNGQILNSQPLWIIWLPIWVLVYSQFRFVHLT